MSQIKINVTQEDITDGHQGKSNDCAIARAIKRELKRDSTSDRVDVTTTSIIVDNVCYKLPQKGADFVRRFDASKAKVRPFSFMLRQGQPVVARRSQQVYALPSTPMQFTYVTSFPAFESLTTTNYIKF